MDKEQIKQLKSKIRQYVKALSKDNEVEYTLGESKLIVMLENQLNYQIDSLESSETDLEKITRIDKEVSELKSKGLNISLKIENYSGASVTEEIPPNEFHSDDYRDYKCENDLRPVVLYNIAMRRALAQNINIVDAISIVKQKIIDEKKIEVVKKLMKKTGALAENILRDLKTKVSYRDDNTFQYDFYFEKGDDK